MEVWRSVNKTNQLLSLVCYLSFTTVLKPSVNFSKSKNAMSQKMPWQVWVPWKTESLLRHPKAGFFLTKLIEQWCLSNTFIQIKTYLWTEINNSVTAINNSTSPSFRSNPTTPVLRHNGWIYLSSFSWCCSWVVWCAEGRKFETFKTVNSFHEN